MMTRVEALKWIAETFEESPERITPETAQTDVPAWDSLGVLTLMAGLDREFGVVLADGEIQQVKTVGDILGLLSKNGKLRD